MGYSIELKKSSSQQPSQSGKEKVASSRGNKSLKFPEKHKDEVNELGQSRIEQNHDSQQYADNRPTTQNKVSRNCLLPSKSNKKNDDELVKHMSDLPGYLQQTEREENVQEKALNFGVLDWKRLERWKNDDKHLLARGIKKVSSSSNNSSYMAGGKSIVSGTAQRKISISQRKQLPSHGSHPESAFEQEQGVRSKRNVTKPQGYETAPWSAINMMQKLQPHDQPSRPKHSEISLDEGKWKESECNARSDMVNQSLSFRKHELSSSCLDTVSAKDKETNTTMVEEFDLAMQSRVSENIVLLVPNNLSQKIILENKQPSKSKKSFDGDLAEAVGRRFSGSFSAAELHSVELYSEIPHSCPFPASVATKVDSDTEHINYTKSQEVKQFDECRIHQRSINIRNPTSEGKYLEVSSSTPETLRRSDQDHGRRPNAKGRHTSPHRRFNFSSIGRMTKSFSFKDISALPQSNSSSIKAKCGPVGSLSFVDSKKFNQDNAIVGNGARSSPLRRLLDPLLKPRVHSAELVQPLKINIDPVNIKPVDITELHQSRDCETSCVQALLQLTQKNGLPLFKLVVDNSSDIFAAAVKKLPMPGEDVPSLIYALYSVHETKKKSGNWMSQGSKGKGSSLGYNIIGQIKVSTPPPPGLRSQNKNDQYTVRESILYGVDSGQEDNEKQTCMQSRELAALVINNSEDTKSDEEQSDKSKDCFFDSNSDGTENRETDSTTVILPGGIHGLPTKGLPSPLMNRWRSGGSCDCGGWDVGCKLQILTDHDQIRKNMRPVEGLNLFVEGGRQDKKPIFSLAPFTNDVYSVDFDSSLSLMQAFFIAVGYLSNQKLSTLFEVKMEKENIVEPTNLTIKNPITIQGEGMARYVANPPSSPVGRV